MHTVFSHLHGQSLKIDDTDIYYERLGSTDAPVLLMLHGGLGNITSFNGITPYLAENYQIIGID